MSISMPLLSDHLSCTTVARMMVERRRKDTLVQPEFVLVISGEIHCKIMMQYSVISYIGFPSSTRAGSIGPTRRVCHQIMVLCISSCTECDR